MLRGHVCIACPLVALVSVCFPPLLKEEKLKSRRSIHGTFRTGARDHHNSSSIGTTVPLLIINRYVKLVAVASVERGQAFEV
jgi:hypothetical protein